jgi:RimJ/RimL family protein N-acetyltransferase
MIRLEQFIESPFDEHPQLKTIWPEPSNSDMQEGYTSYIQITKDNPQIDFGPMYLIKNKEKVIGITGVFLEDENGQCYPYDPETHTVYLRWHGIVPSERRKGYSDEAMNLLLKEVQLRYPKIQTLIELIPERSYSESIRKHFEHLGFVPVGEKQKFDWAECFWQAYHLNVPQYLNKLEQKEDKPSVKKMKF